MTHKRPLTPSIEPHDSDQLARMGTPIVRDASYWGQPRPRFDYWAALFLMWLDSQGIKIENRRGGPSCTPSLPVQRGSRQLRRSRGYQPFMVRPPETLSTWPVI
jgi:hypothetical protein